MVISTLSGLFAYPRRSIKRLNKKRELQREQDLLNRLRAENPPDAKRYSIFTAGYYHTGTRWINELILENTPPGLIYSSKNQHRYIDDNYRLAEFGKHGRLDQRLLAQRALIVIYLLRDFDSWIQAFLNNTYEVRLDGDIASSTYGWPSMNIYDLYARVTKTNIGLLRESGANYVIANLGYCQRSAGMDLLELLELHGVQFSRPLIPILKHTKEIENRGLDRKRYDVSMYKHRTDSELEDLIASSAEALEYRFSHRIETNGPIS